MTLITRGNGEIGQDISHLSSYINLNIIKTIDKEIIVRGELIIS